MDEVTCRATTVLLALVEQRGLATAPLVDGLAVPPERLRSGRGYLDWSVWAELLDRIEHRLGPDALENLGLAVCELPIRHEFKQVARLLSSARRLYRLNSRWAVTADFRCLRSECADLAGGRLRILMEIPARLRASPAHFRFSKGILGGIPILIGEPRAQIQADVGDHRAVYTVALPAAATLWARTRRAVYAFAGIRTALEQLGVQEQEILEKNRRLEDQLEAQQRVEHALRASEERWRSLAENAPGLILVVDAAGVIRSANRAIFGVTPSVAVGRSVYEFVAEDFHEPLRAAFTHALASHEGTQLEVRARRASAAWYATSIARVEDAGRVQTFILMFADVSDRKRAEEALRLAEDRLRQAQKMESIGRLAGGIAHDFNNLLTIILSYASMLLSELHPGEQRRTEIEQIKLASERAATLTTQILAFSRQAVLAPTVTDLNAVVEGTEKMLRRTIGENITLCAHLASGLNAVEVDRGQIDQILLNLAINSRDAMPDGGTLTIETANVELDETYAASHQEVKPGPHVMLVVSDTGRGIEPEHRSLVFEPFFTTKERGRGTGLGLATVRGIVQQSGGSVCLYSEVGVGTTIKLYFPVATGEAGDGPPLAARKASRAGNETIALVEDDAQVRAAASAILSKHGYRVIEASGPVEAIALVEENRTPIDLLLTDAVMPGMNGRQLADHLVAERPRMKVLFMSGYAESVIVHHGIVVPGASLLSKPFSQESLTERVREVLDAPGT